MEIKYLHKNAEIFLGIIPSFLSDNGRPAKEQLHDNYAHGGGWDPMKGWTRDTADNGLSYPGDDEKLLPVAEITLGEEKIYVYRHAWVMILQPTGEFEVSRMD